MPQMSEPVTSLRPRVVGDAVIIGKETVLARRFARSGCWEVEKHHPVALARLLSMAYGKRISSGSDMVKLLEKAAAALPRNLREADQIISGLPEPLAEAEARVEAGNRLLKDGVSPYRLTEALRGEQLGLSPAPAWNERLTLCDRGIVLGKGTVIVALTDDGLDLEGKEADVLALLSLARRSLAPAEALEKLAAVSRAVMAGNISVAAITLAQLGQPPLVDEELAKSLMVAANRLKRGVTPLELLQKAGFSRVTLEKAYGKSAAWDENLHPRDEKGRFGNGSGGGSSGSDTSTPAVGGRNLDTSDLTGRYGTDISSTAPGKPSLNQQYAANETGTKNDASGESQSHSAEENIGRIREICRIDSSDQKPLSPDEQKKAIDSLHLSEDEKLDVLEYLSKRDKDDPKVNGITGPMKAALWDTIAKKPVYNTPLMGDEVIERFSNSENVRKIQDLCQAREWEKTPIEERQRLLTAVANEIADVYGLPHQYKVDLTSDAELNQKGQKARFDANTNTIALLSTLKVGDYSPGVLSAVAHEMTHAWQNYQEDHPSDSQTADGKEVANTMRGQDGAAYISETNDPYYNRQPRERQAYAIENYLNGPAGACLGFMGRRTLSKPRRSKR